MRVYVCSRVVWMGCLDRVLWGLKDESCEKEKMSVWI